MLCIRSLVARNAQIENGRRRNAFDGSATVDMAGACVARVVSAMWEMIVRGDFQRVATQREDLRCVDCGPINAWRVEREVHAFRRPFEGE